MRLVSYCRNISMKMIHMNTVNSKKNAPHKFVFSLSQGLDFRSSNKYVTLQNIYYTWENIRQQFKNNKLNSSSVK